MVSLEEVLDYAHGKNPPGVIVHERTLPGPEPAGEGRPHPASLTAPIEKENQKPGS